MASGEVPLAMSPTPVAYDPARVDELRRRAAAVSDHLARLPMIEDPLAADAVSVARLVFSHFDQGWLPTLDRVAASTALTAGMSVHAIGEVERRAAGPTAWPFGLTNAEARSRAEEAAAARRTGRFVGTTLTYEVLETPPSTTIPVTGHDQDAGSGRFDILVEDHWYVEHNLGTGPATFASVPMFRWGGLVAKLFGRHDRDPELEARGQELERMAGQARVDQADGEIASWRNVAAGRLTREDGEVTEFRSISGRHPRRSFEEVPAEPVFEVPPGFGEHSEFKILDAIARQLRRSETDSVVEIFTERPPCSSCDDVLERFHDMFPDVQVRVYFREDIAAG
jgi:hypothetical protein